MSHTDIWFIYFRTKQYIENFGFNLCYARLLRWSSQVASSSRDSPPISSVDKRSALLGWPSTSEDMFSCARKWCAVEIVQCWESSDNISFMPVDVFEFKYSHNFFLLKWCPNQPVLMSQFLFDIFKMYQESTRRCTKKDTACASPQLRISIPVGNLNTDSLVFGLFSEMSQQCNHHMFDHIIIDHMIKKSCGGLWIPDMRLVWGRND